MKTDFHPFLIGTVFNPLPSLESVPSPVCEGLLLRYPSRLNAMALDPSRITTNNNLVYQAGEIVLSTGLYRQVQVRVLAEKGNILVEETSRNSTLIRHAAEIMRKVIGFSEGLAIGLTTIFD